MKRFIAALAVLAASCSSAAPPAAINPPVTQLAGAPCNPPGVIPASIVASVRARLEGAAPVTVSADDQAAYQAMTTNQRANDWANLCNFRADNAALAAAPPQPDRIVFMGDSITQMWALADPAFFGPAVVNRGISGQTTPQMLLRFRADVLALKPVAVHIMAGVNDIAGNTGPTTLEDVEGNLAAMVELAKAHNVKVILATVLPAATFTWAPKLQPRDSVIQLNTWIRAYAAQQGLVLADYFDAMATSDGAMKPELTLDGVHPNKAGYAVLKPMTEAAMKAALAR
jgi:lysophospholipase L1-like esterase